MKKQSKEITVGKAAKYKRVKMDVAKIIALVQIRQAGFRDSGRNRLPAQLRPESHAPRAGAGGHLQTHSKEGRQEKGRLNTAGHGVVITTPQP